MYFDNYSDMLLFMFYWFAHILIWSFLIIKKKRYCSKKLVIPLSTTYYQPYKHPKQINKVFMTTSVLFLVNIFKAITYGEMYATIVICLISIISLINWINFNADSIRNKIDAIFLISCGLFVSYLVYHYKLSVLLAYCVANNCILFFYSVIFCRIYKNHYWIKPHFLMHCQLIIATYILVEEVRFIDPVRDFINFINKNN